MIHIRKDGPTTVPTHKPDFVVPAFSMVCRFGFMTRRFADDEKNIYLAQSKTLGSSLVVQGMMEIINGSRSL